jgi:hypothetical protein
MSLKKYSKWTSYEDELLINNIKTYPNNLVYSFEQTSSQINRSVDSIRLRYYNVLKHDGIIFGVGSDKGVVINVKNTKRILEQDEDDLELLVITLFEKLNNSQKKRILEKVF